MRTLIRCTVINQVDNFNEPSLLSLQDFDDRADLSNYNFDGDNLTVPVDSANKKKLAYRHRVVGELYEKVKKPPINIYSILIQMRLKPLKPPLHQTCSSFKGEL